jgi:hypothetical protein
MEEANAGFQRQIDFIRNTKGGTVSADAAAAASAPGAAASSGGGGAAGGSVSSEPAAPSPINAEPPSSGSALSDASSQVAEAQRMESTADVGSSVNAPVTNNNTGSSGKEPTKLASAYDEEFAKLLATT